MELAVVVPIWLVPSNIKMVEETSAVPDMTGLLLLVEVLLAGLVMIGLAGGVVSIVIRNINEAGLTLPAASLDFAVME